MVVKFAGSSRIAWGPFEPPAAWTELLEMERRQNEPTCNSAVTPVFGFQ